jgi:hypothetical protein
MNLMDGGLQIGDGAGVDAVVGSERREGRVFLPVQLWPPYCLPIGPSLFPANAVSVEIAAPEKTAATMRASCPASMTYLARAALPVVSRDS